LPEGVSPYQGEGLPEGVSPYQGEGLPEGVSPYEGEGLPEGVTPYQGDDVPEGAPEQSREPPEPGAPSEPSASPSVSPSWLGDLLASYVAQFRHLDVTERIAIAKTADDPDLLTLCLDPDPQVVTAVLNNPRSGPFHARRIALHHRSTLGLEQLARKGELVRDAQVQRNLLRNPHLSESLLQRLVTSKPLSEIYKLCLDRELPEQSRLKVRAEIRKRFNNASADEKVELVVRTEGRVLMLLAGCTFDPKSAALLAQRTIGSLVLVQNLARFPATPPAVLAKLAQLPIVTRQPGIRQLVLRHPNLPGEAKRRG
jgi:hypothetical protein